MAHLVQRDRITVTAVLATATAHLVQRDRTTVTAVLTRKAVTLTDLRKRKQTAMALLPLKKTLLPLKKKKRQKNRNSLPAAY